MFNIYSPKCKGVSPSIFLALTPASLDNKYSTIPLWPSFAAINKTLLINLFKYYLTFIHQNVKQCFLYYL